MVDAGVIGAAISASVVVGGAVLYVIRSEQAKEVARLDGRMNTHEAGCDQRQKKLDERYETQTKHLASIDDKLDRLLEAR